MKKEFNLKHKVEFKGKETEVIITGFKNRKQVDEFIKCLENDWE